MYFMMLESGPVILALMVAMEMRRQHRAWRFVLINSFIVFGTLTAMILMWRGV